VAVSEKTSLTPLPGPPDIGGYQDYRRFLADAYAFKKSTRAGLSFRALAAKAGFRSPNYLQLVMKSERNLSNESALRVAKALGLSRAEATYFEALVARDNAENPAERERAERRVLGSVRKLVTREIAQAQSEVLRRWYLLPLRELVFLPDFEPDGAWISARMRGLVTPAQAEEGVATLLRAGFLVKKKNRLVACDPVIDTAQDGFDFYRVLLSHQETLTTWVKALEGLGAEERELGLINIPLSSAKVPEFKRRIRAFQDEIIGWLQDEKDPDQVVQLGTYLVPLTRSGKAS